MRKIITGISILILLSTQMLSAQQPSHGEGRTDALEKMKKQRAEYIVNELGLTEAEKAKFIPLLDKYIKDRFEIYREHLKEVRELREREKKTDQDYNRLIDSHLESEAKKLELEKNFHIAMRKIISAEKAYKYRSVEQEFMAKTLDKRKERHLHRKR